jgi:hypothetical protein
MEAEKGGKLINVGQYSHQHDPNRHAHEQQSQDAPSGVMARLRPWWIGCLVGPHPPEALERCSQTTRHKVTKTQTDQAQLPTRHRLSSVGWAKRLTQQSFAPI